MVDILLWGLKKKWFPQKDGGGPNVRKENSGCFKGVINQLRILKKLQNDMANILFWGPKMDDPEKWVGAQKSEKKKKPLAALKV